MGMTCYTNIYLGIGAKIPPEHRQFFGEWAEQYQSKYAHDTARVWCGDDHDGNSFILIGQQMTRLETRWHTVGGSRFLPTYHANMATVRKAVEDLFEQEGLEASGEFGYHIVTEIY